MRCKKCFGVGTVLVDQKLIKCPECKGKKPKANPDTVTFDVRMAEFARHVTRAKYRNGLKKKSPYRADFDTALDKLTEALHEVRMVLNAGKRTIYRSPYDKG